MTYVGAVPTTGDFKLLDSITTSSTTTFNLRQGGVAVFPQSANHCIVQLNGVNQVPTSSFNIVNDTIVFASSLSSNDVINQILVLGNVNDIGVPSDDTVSQAKIQSEVINEAKMQISNAPVNGYMLTAQSGNTGGLTWAEAPSGGVSGWTSSSGNLLPDDASKGIYLGVNSATASNLLNDYEYGTWTPTWTFGTSGSANTANAGGNWFKVGDFVTVYGYIAQGGSISSPTGTTFISGLPFTPSGGYGQNSAFHGQGWVSGAFGWGTECTNGNTTGACVSDGHHPTGITVRTNGLELASQGVSPLSDTRGGRSYSIDAQTNSFSSNGNYGQCYFGAVYKT